LNNSASASDREGMAFLIMTGNFIGYLPSHYAADCVAAGMLRPLLPELFHYPIALTSVTRKGRPPNLVLERFLEAVAV
ncbi:LuxR family transcriptional regulator, partial [Pseudomonas aeruginosa]